MEDYFATRNVHQLVDNYYPNNITGLKYLSYVVFSHEKESGLFSRTNFNVLWKIFRNKTNMMRTFKAIDAVILVLLMPEQG